MGTDPRLSIYGGLALGSWTNIDGMEATTGNLLPYLGILCRMLVKNEVFNVFARGVTKPEILLEMNERIFQVYSKSKVTSRFFQKRVVNSWWQLK